MKTIKQGLDEAYREVGENAYFGNGFKAGIDFAEKWISVEYEPIPKDGNEYLTMNENQGGVLNLISWNKFHGCYESKGEYIFEGNAGTHWREININN